MSTYYIGDNPWIHCDVFTRRCYDEMNTSAPVLYRGTDWFIYLCAFWNDTTLVDVGSWGHLYMSLYPKDILTSAARIFQKDITTTNGDDGQIYTDCTLPHWQDRTKKQAMFYCIDSITGGTSIATAGIYTCVFHGVNTDETKKFVLGKTNIEIVEAGI